MSSPALRIPFGGLLLCLVILICAACTGGQSLPTPSLSASDPVTATPTSTVTIPVFTVVTTTLTDAPSARLITLDTLNIRSGPGVNYATVGAFAPEAEARILGQSEDRLWWQVACPIGTRGDICWVIADPLFGEAIDAFTVPVAHAPPTLTITPTPSPTPCVPNAPAGWAPYQVQLGDTLFELALQTDVTVAELAGINCLETDLLEVNSMILLPTVAYTPDLNVPLPTRSITAVSGLTFDSGDGAATGGGADSGGALGAGLGEEGASTPVTPQRDGMAVSPDTVAIGIVRALSGGSPNRGQCDVGGDERKIVIMKSQCGVTSAADEKTTWEVAQRFNICVSGLPANATVEVQMPLADRPPQELAFVPMVKGWWWSVLPGAPLGVYTVTAKLGADIAPPATFTVTSPLTGTRNLLVVTDSIIATVAPGEFISVAVAGLDAGQSLFLYRYDENVIPDFPVYWELSTPILNERGEGIARFPVFDSDLVLTDILTSTQFAVGDGVFNGDILSNTDCRVFFVSE